MLAPYSKQRSVTVLLNLKRPLKRPSRETEKEEKRLYEEATSFFHPSPGTNFCFLSLPAAFHKAKKGGGLLFWCFAFSENASNNRLRPSPPASSLKKAQCTSLEIKPQGWNTLIKVELCWRRFATTVLLCWGIGEGSEAATVQSLNGFYGNWSQL